MKKNQKIIAGVVAVVVAIGFFYGGVAYGKSHASPMGMYGRAGAANAQGGNAAYGQFAGRGGAAGGAARAGGGAVAGKILSQDADSITVALASGGSKIVFTSASTTVAKMATGSVADLAAGTNVIVQGSTNSDGSVTANSIQIRPDMPNMPMGAGRGTPQQ